MDNQVKKLIESKYGISITSVQDGPRQFVAETYIVNTPQKTFFLKVIPNGVHADSAIANLPILQAVHTSHVVNCNYPVNTKDGHLSVTSDGSVYILFNFISGKQTFAFAKEKVGEMVGRLHEFTTDKKIKTEAFTFVYHNDFWKIVEKVNVIHTHESVIEETKSLLKTHLLELYRDWDNFVSDMKLCQQTAYSPVVTHGDVFGNIMQDDSRELHIVDWDTILLAPAERDTWFMKGEEDFFKGYCQSFPEYSFNVVFYRFYLYKRYFEDIYEFVEKILSNLSEDEKQKHLQGLKDDCFETWLGPVVRALD